jgi:hypothetical protein
MSHCYSVNTAVNTWHKTEEKNIVSITAIIGNNKMFKRYKLKTTAL